jgi:hypothetical protein
MSRGFSRLVPATPFWSLLAYPVSSKLRESLKPFVSDLSKTLCVNPFKDQAGEGIRYRVLFAENSIYSGIGCSADGAFRRPATESAAAREVSFASSLKVWSFTM